jgi:PKD repeat protein
MGFDFTVVFTDPDGIINLGFATFAWGDGDTSTCPLDTAACSIDLEAGSGDQATSSSTFTVGEAQGRHAYSEPGIYTVQLTLRDEFGQFDTATFEFVIVYDPSGGFVTGGGWIDSPAGAYKPDPSLMGMATFGFVSTYKKGATVPIGKTEFQFQVADLNFHSDTYQWLVVNQHESRAQFKGEGTINGAVAPTRKNYQFMIWATDGDPDTFRIKIWYEDGSSDVIVYDNGIDQPIGGGGILVHTAKNAK